MDASEVMQREAIRNAGKVEGESLLSYASFRVEFGDEGGYLVESQDRTGKRVKRVFTDREAARSFVEDFWMMVV